LHIQWKSKSPNNFILQWFLVVVSLLASFLLYALDTTIVATIQPAIVGAFGHMDLVPWLSVAFALASAASTLIWSKAFGLFSAKKLFLGATTLFMAASALCGGAPDITAFIVGRALAGIGGTGMYMGLLTILSVNTSDVERPRYLSLTGFWWGVGTVLGPVVGGAFAESSATWRWAFYLNPCVGGVVAPIYFLILPDYHPVPGVSLRSRLAKLDYIGATLSCGLSLCIMMAMNFGGVLWSWGNGRSIALFVLSSVLFGLFCAQQILCFMTTTTDRIFPMHFFRSYEMIILFVTMSMYYFLLEAETRFGKINALQCFPRLEHSSPSTISHCTSSLLAAPPPSKPRFISCPIFSSSLLAFSSMDTSCPRTAYTIHGTSSALPFK
jgi:MFS family permease